MIIDWKIFYRWFQAQEFFFCRNEKKIIEIDFLEVFVKNIFALNGRGKKIKSQLEVEQENWTKLIKSLTVPF